MAKKPSLPLAKTTSLVSSSIDLSKTWSAYVSINACHDSIAYFVHTIAACFFRFFDVSSMKQILERKAFRGPGLGTSAFDIIHLPAFFQLSFPKLQDPSLSPSQSQMDTALLLSPRPLCMTVIGPFSTETWQHKENNIRHLYIRKKERKKTLWPLEGAATKSGLVSLNS